MHVHTQTHTHTNTQTVHRVIISRAVGSSLGFIMWKQSPWSVSLWTMTWWSEVLEGWGFVPAEWLLLMDDNKLERSTLKLLSFTCAASLCWLARWRRQTYGNEYVHKRFIVGTRQTVAPKTFSGHTIRAKKENDIKILPSVNILMIRGVNVTIHTQ